MLTTFLLVWLRANSTTAGMVFLVLVVWLASQAGVVLSLYIAAVSALFFDYYFLPPMHTFRLVGAQAWVAMVSFALSCVVVSRLAERARQQTLQAEQRQIDVGRLYALSQEMMLFEDADQLIRDMPALIDRIFALEGVLLYVCDHDRFYTSTIEAPASVQSHMRAVTQGLNSTLAPLDGYRSTALMLGLRPVGALAWRPETLSREVAAAISAQVSIAVAPPSPSKPQRALKLLVKVSGCAPRSSIPSPMNCALRSLPSAPQPQPSLKVKGSMNPGASIWSASLTKRRRGSICSSAKPSKWPRSMPR